MGIKLRNLAALILATLVPSGALHAEESASPSVVTGVDGAEIQLKNGGSMRGTIVAVEPGQRVIVIVAGEQSVIPWGEVARIVGGPKESNPGATPAAPTPQTPTSPSAVPAAGPMKGMPYFHVESDWPDEVELQRVDGEIGGGVFTNKNQIGPQTLSHYMCVAPCDKLVDGREGHRFFFSAPGMFPSQQFRLEQYDGYVTARVRGVSVGRIVSGVMLTGAGGIFTLGGTMFFAFSFLPNMATPKNPNPDEAAHQVRTAGIVLGSIGIGMVAGGIALLSAGRTRVDLIKNSRGETALALDGGVLRF